MTDTLYSNIEIADGDNSQIAITGSVSWDKLQSYYQTTLEKMAADVELDGFRKGKAPQDQVEAKIGQMAIMQEAAQRVLGDVYPAIVMDKKLSVVGYPQISLTKLAHGSDLEFLITSAVLPTIQLGDYKKSAAKHNKEETVVEITDEELDQNIEQLMNMHAHTAHQHEEGADAAEHNHEIPELNDEFVKKIGDFKDVADFKEKMKSQLLEQKEQSEKGKRREAIILDIAQQSDFEVPEILIEAEKDKMLGAMKDDISRMGLEYSAWLEHSGKTEEEMRSEMTKDATERARAELVLKEIAKVEKISANQEEMDAQIAQIKQAHPDAPEDNVRLYVENIYINEAVCQFLESQK